MARFPEAEVRLLIKSTCMDRTETSSEVGELLPVDRTPMAKGQDIDDFLFAVHVDDNAIVSYPQLVRLNGAELGQVSCRLLCHDLQLSRDPLLDRLIQLTKLFRRQL